MTLLEVALASTLVVGLSAGVMMTLRMHQMVKLGEAAGEQLADVDEGVGRYLAQHGAAVAALPVACAQIPYVGGFQIGNDSSQLPNVPPGACELTVNGEKVQNGYQPTVAELVKLNYVRASGDLMLPYRDEVTDISTGQKAAPVLAVSIAVEQGAGEGTGTDGTNSGPGSLREIATFSESTGRMPVDYDSNGLLTRVYEVNCSDTTKRELIVIDSLSGGSKSGVTIAQNTSGKEYCEYYKNNGQAPDSNQWQKHYPGELVTLFGVDCYNRNEVKIGPSLTYSSGSQLCWDYRRAAMPASFIQQLQTYWTGISGIGAAGTVPAVTGTGTGTAPKPAMRLHSLVYNLQPYYAGEPSLPFGAAAQMAAALHAAGYKGRLIMPGTKPEDSVMLTGLRGTQVVRNPIARADGSGAQPGILAAESWYYLKGSTATPIGGGGGGGVATSEMECDGLSKVMCRDGSVTPTGTWDFNDKDLSKVGTLSANVIGAQKISLLQIDNKANNPLVPLEATAGRATVLEIRGNVQMQKDTSISTDHLNTNQLTSQILSSPNIAAPDLIEVGSEVGKMAGTLFVHNNAGLRLPRALPGTRCDGNNMSDIAMSYPGKIVLKSTYRETGPIVAREVQALSTDVKDNLGHSWRRFLLVCGGGNFTSLPNESIWRNSEYEALNKSMSSKNMWTWLVPKDTHDRDSDLGYTNRRQ